jgi:hypothetical protein
MEETFGLIDCNNFYVSCKGVFRPDLEGVPVIVLSNNNGCAVARSADYGGISWGVNLWSSLQAALVLFPPAVKKGVISTKVGLLNITRPYNRGMVPQRVRNWLRVLAFAALLVALAGDFSASRALHFTGMQHVVIARRVVSSSGSGVELLCPLSRYSTPREMSSSLEHAPPDLPLTNRGGQVLRVRAQPRSCGLYRPSRGTQVLQFQEGQRHFAIQIAQPALWLHPARSPQVICFWQRYSRPPPLLV